MAKRMTKGFAAKTEKSLHDYRQHCPVCGEAIEPVKHVVTISDDHANIRFKEKMVGVCKCNRNEIYQS